MKIKSTFAAGKLETSEYSKIERVGLKGMKVKGLNKYIPKKAYIHERKEDKKNWTCFIFLSNSFR